MFVVNLAFSDFCMMITQFPMFVHNSFNGGIWLFGPAACELYACLGIISINFPFSSCVLLYTQNLQEAFSELRASARWLSSHTIDTTSSSRAWPELKWHSVNFKKITQSHTWKQLKLLTIPWLLERAAILIACCWIYATGWCITPYFGFGRYIPEGILDSCSFDYLTRDEKVYNRTGIFNLLL